MYWCIWLVMLVIHYSWVGLFYVVSAQLIYRHNAAVNVTVILSQRAPSEHFSFCSGFHRQNVATHLAHLRLLVMVTGSEWKVSLAQRSWPNDWLDLGREIRCDQVQQQNLCLEPGIWEWRVEVELLSLLKIAHMELLRQIIIIWSFSPSSSSSELHCS